MLSKKVGRYALTEQKWMNEAEAVFLHEEVHTERLRGQPRRCSGAQAAVARGTAGGFDSTLSNRRTVENFSPGDKADCYDPFSCQVSRKQ